VWEWLFCIGILVVGIALLAVYLLDSSSGTTPEEDLTLVEGVATEVRTSSVSGSEILEFKVAGHQTEYASDRPKYEQVLVAVGSGQPVRVWISTRQETLFPRQGWVPLYKMSVGDQPVLEYAEVVGHKAEGAYAALVVGCVLCGVGA
jgi:hypothetical protein